MTRYAAVIEYDGARYHGWQLQKGVPTVQGELELALKRILGRDTRVHGAGRTDAGVHAVGQVAHFDAEWKHSATSLQNACNALLPPDIAILGLRQTSDDFHARYRAISKTYVYRILNSELRSPLNRLYAWHISYKLNFPLMVDATSHLFGTHDFAAFGSPTDGTPSTVRNISEVQWNSGQFHVFTIRGSGFLRYMVRSLVGTLVQVGKEKISPLEFLVILQSRSRSRSGPTAPAHGLCLHSVQYDPEEFLIEHLKHSAKISQ
jgi:tRNA pseudouridine38-40 synthase